MKKIILIFIYLITCISCNENNNRIIISNRSGNIIDSIVVSTNMKCDPIKFINIKSNSTIDTIFKSCIDKQAGDGCFHVSLYGENQVINKSFGYYTNGVPVFKQMKIIYQNKNNCNIIFE